MVKYPVSNTDAVFHALSHEVRRTILRRLLSGPATVSELTEPFHISFPAITKHLDVLEKSKLIFRRKQGRQILITLNSGPLLEVKKWLSDYENFWVRQLESLSSLFSPEL